MITAFVLSGGGSLGAVQVGMLQALADHQVHPDLLVGTSVGAVNAAYVAGHGVSAETLAGLELIWRGLRRRDVFPLSAARAAAAVARTTPSLCANTSLRELISRHLTFDRLEDAPIPVKLVATDVRSGAELLLAHGDATDAVLASAAIPAVFPAVQFSGHFLVDGGIANNAAISHAVTLGADRVYVLPSGYACALDRPPATVLASALQALTLLIQQRLVLEVARYAEQVDLRVLPPLCPLTISSTDFRHAGELIQRAATSTGRWLATDGGIRAKPERFLSLHTHPYPAAAPAA